MFYMSYVLCFFSENCPQKPLVYSWVICQSGTWLSTNIKKLKVCLNINQSYEQSKTTTPERY